MIFLSTYPNTNLALFFKLLVGVFFLPAKLLLQGQESLLHLRLEVDALLFQQLALGEVPVHVLRVTAG